jgi:protein TonB
VEGTVRVRYEINYEGKVVSTKILSGVGHGCDEEAIRLIKLLKFEVPKHRKMKVAFHKTTNIHFRIPKVQPKAQTKTITYQYQASSKQEDSKIEKGSSGYGYTIKIN